METEIAEEYKTQAIFRMDESSRMIKRCLEQLTDEELWKSPNESSNSIANLMIHLSGNIRQYAISSLAETDDNRQRDLEFSTHKSHSKAALEKLLFGTVEEAKNTIENLSTDKLLKKRYVQGFHFSGIGVITHVVEHYSYHTGQIALLTKLLKNNDLGFYDDFDLNTKNEV